MIDTLDNGRRRVVLLVEDNQLDVELTRQCFNEVAPSVRLCHVANGVEAMSYLRREGQHAEAPRPQLVLLDLNMPMMDGREMLAQMKNDAALKHIPVVVLTNSQSAEDVLKSYQLLANSYIRKPLDFEQFLEITQVLVNYWFDLTELPSEE
jgi:two-component system response regulator